MRKMDQRLDWSSTLNKIRAILLAFLIFSCCKESSVDQEIYLNISETITEDAYHSLITNEVGTVFSPELTDSDITTSLQFKTVNTENIQSYNHLIVSNSDHHPTSTGNKALRFQVNRGDCSWNDSFSDCNTYRTRAEVYEYNRVDLTPNMVLSYEYDMFLVDNSYFNPGNPSNEFSPLTVVSQIYFDDTGIEGDEKGQFYFIVDRHQNLRLRTHKPFTYNIEDQILLLEDIFNKWLKVRIELDNKNNRLRVFVNNSLKHQQPYTFIPENSIHPQYFFKAGIYNSFINDASKEYRTQVVYYDNLERFTE